jgi:hypothetical protein
MVVMKLVVNESSENRSKRHDLPTPTGKEKVKKREGKEQRRKAKTSSRRKSEKKSRN